MKALMLLALLFLVACTMEIEPEKENPFIDKAFYCNLETFRMCNMTWQGEIQCEGDEDAFESMCSLEYNLKFCELCNEDEKER